MSDKVVSLGGSAIPQPGSPNDVVIKVLERYLEEARNGEIAGIAVCALHSDRAASYHTGGFLDAYSILGALDVVKADLCDLVRGIE